MKVAVVVPCHGGPKTGFAMSLARLAWQTGRSRPDIELGFFTIASSRLPAARNKLVEAGLGWGADYVFMLDADHVFPADALVRLLERQRPVIGINQPTRSDCPEPTARDDDGTLIYTTPDKGGTDERVSWLGLAMVLASRDALGKLERPLFAYDGDAVGEDHFFCRRLKAAGVPLFVDHGLSAEVRHIHTIELGNEDTLREGRPSDAHSDCPSAGSQQR